MRLILTTVILTMFAQPVWAMSIDRLYTFCKPYAENQFQIDGLTELERFNAAICSGWHAGSQSTAETLCVLGGGVGANAQVKNAFGTSITNSKTVIQLFISWAENNRDDWQQRAMPFLWLANTCNG